MDIQVHKINESFVRVTCEAGISQELYEYFSFYAEGFQFHPLFKKKIWNGKLHLFKSQDNSIYGGLLHKLVEFAKTMDYTMAIADDLTSTENFSLFEAGRFVETLKLPSHIENREFQINTFVSCIRNKRELFVSPTGSGKSLILYLIIRYLKEVGYKKGLIIVPTKSLVEQLYDNFKNDFDWKDTDKHVHRIYQGKDKHTPHFLTISTWQSMSLQTPEYLQQFDFVMGDEAHTFKAKELSKLMVNLSNARVRVGCTGSLDGAKVNKLVLEGLFGPVKQYVTTKDLIDSGDLSDLMIKCLVLRYPEETIKAHKKDTAQEELDFIVQNKIRNKFIKNLALSLKGNTIILYQFVEKQGMVLYRLLQEEASDKKIYLIYGDTPVEERERIRKEAEFIDNAIIVASYGTFSTGINIKNLHNYIQASPSKSTIRVLQSIGRVLRTCHGKTIATLFDIVDDMRHKKTENYAVDHFKSRLTIYQSQKFKFKMYKIDIKGDVNG